MQVLFSIVMALVTWASLSRFMSTGITGLLVVAVFVFCDSRLASVVHWP